jgi:hypothetical protein
MKICAGDVTATSRTCSGNGRNSATTRGDDTILWGPPATAVADLLIMTAGHSGPAAALAIARPPTCWAYPRAMLSARYPTDTAK